MKKGDREAIKAFVTIGTDWIYNMVLSYVHTTEDAEEVVQDSLLGAIKGLDKFRSEASLKTWTYQIAINKSKDFLKYKTRQKRSGIMFSIDERSENKSTIELYTNYHPGVQLEQKEDYDLLWKSINQLPEKQKQALLLAKIDKKPQAEIAELMDISVKAVESLLSRSKANLKKYIGNNPK